MGTPVTPVTEVTVDVIRGWNFPPALVGIVRGAIEAAVLAGLAVIGTNFDTLINLLPQSIDNALNAFGVTEVMLISGGFWALRSAEALADQYIDPNQNRNADLRARTP